MKKINTVSMRLILLLPFLAVCFQAMSSAPQGALKDTVEEKIWAQEAAYFTHFYKAEYAEMLALVHDQFLGWPGGQTQPIGKQESSRFMKQAVPKATNCRVKIERAGIRVVGSVALTQYTIHVNCSDSAGVATSQSSIITHTWVKEGTLWKLLGGMSAEIK
jgi:ketosteroid isomerase-like protein